MKKVVPKNFHLPIELKCQQQVCFKRMLLKIPDFFLSSSRVARWFVFKPKIPIWVNWVNAGIFYGHLEYLTVIWYILWLFGYVEVIWYILWIFGYVVEIWYILWIFGYVVVIWYIFPRFGILCQEKSGNTDLKTFHWDNKGDYIACIFLFHASMPKNVLCKKATSHEQMSKPSPNPKECSSSTHNMSSAGKLCISRFSANIF
jgi:hypothetical protein